MGSPFVTAAEFERAKEIVYEVMQPTLQHAWPLLGEELGCEVWVKHENHTPLGAFKVRGGLVHMRTRVERGGRGGVITASTGNHGQSIPFAAAREGVPAVVVVPTNNAREKNAAMRSLGAELLEVGHDFIAAKEAAESLAAERGLDMVASFQPDLVQGVSTYAFELFEAAGDLDAVYVPIGLGSGICGVMAARHLMGRTTEVIGVVPARANAYRLSFDAGRAVSTESADSFAEGMGVREPNLDAVEAINAGVERVVEVSEDEIAEAMRLLFRTTHNVAEGAGAGAVAALTKERSAMAGKRVGVILTGGNVDADKFAEVLRGDTPTVG